MAFGSFGAFLHGITLPGQLVIFGLLMTRFVEFQKQIIERDAGKNATVTIDIEDEMLVFSQIYAYAAVFSWLVGYMQWVYAVRFLVYNRHPADPSHTTEIL